MVAKKKRMTKAAKRMKAARKKSAVTVPDGPPIVKLELTVQEAKIIIGGLMELPMKVVLPIVNKVQAGMHEALTVKGGK